MAGVGFKVVIAGVITACGVGCVLIAEAVSVVGILVVVTSFGTESDIGSSEGVDIDVFDPCPD